MSAAMFAAGPGWPGGAPLARAMASTRIPARIPSSSPSTTPAGAVHAGQDTWSRSGVGSGGAGSGVAVCSSALGGRGLAMVDLSLRLCVEQLGKTGDHRHAGGSGRAITSDQNT